ncbi:restriction endonuclease subunit S [Campylobacter upsaliensis]|nr:restriction endonuclease subunit S [Campylobacter upsaliensis]
MPKHWEIKKLKYIGEIFGGVIGKTIKDFSKEYKPNFKPYITFTNVCNNAIINPNSMEYVFIDFDEKQNKVLKNDILFLQSSETFEDVGKNAIYLNDDEVYLNTFCKGFRIEREAYPMYLNYLLSSLSYKRYFMSVCSGFTRINLRQEHFLDIPLILPPLQEQKEIAEFLDSKVAQINSAIEKTKRQIELVREYKNTLINEAVCGRIKLKEVK